MNYIKYSLILSLILLGACKSATVDPALNIPSKEGNLGTPNPTPTPLPLPTPTVDSTPPIVILHQKPSGISNKQDQVVTFTIEDKESGVETVDCTLNGQVFAPCASPVNLKNLDDGEKDFEISATDKAGNASSKQSAKWIVDLGGPEMTIKSKPSSPTTETTADFAFDASNDRSGVEGIFCSLDGSNFEACQSPVTYRQLARANHTFKVYARDKSGNDGDVVSVSWTITGLPALPTTPYALEYTKPNGNGWFPAISDDGRYIAYGFGGSWVYDRTSKQESDLNHVSNIYCNQWIRPGVLTQCQSTTNNTMNRYEIDMSNRTPVLTSDDPSLVAGNYFWVSEGSWASWLSGRIAMNNQVLYASGVGAFGMSKNWHFYTDPDHSIMHIYRDGQFLRDKVPQTPLHESRMWGGYIIYGGYAGGIRGIDPSGNDTDHTAVPWRFEGPGAVFPVNGQPWVVSTTWDEDRADGFVLVRPWGAKDVMIIHLQLVNPTAVQVGNDLIIAGNTDKGQIYILKVPVNAPRFTIQ
jgi:hypothetical protein